MNAPTIVILAATGLILVFSSIAMTATRLAPERATGRFERLETGIFPADGKALLLPAEYPYRLQHQTTSQLPHRGRL